MNFLSPTNNPLLTQYSINRQHFLDAGFRSQISVHQSPLKIGTELFILFTQLMAELETMQFKGAFIV